MKCELVPLSLQSSSSLYGVAGVFGWPTRPLGVSGEGPGAVEMTSVSFISARRASWGDTEEGEAVVL
jgi:hypothetical protein